MGYETNAKNGHTLLVRGPVNTALYDLRSGKVYSINPLMADVIEGRFDKDRSCKSQTIKRDTLKVLRRYLSRHPALAGLGLDDEEQSRSSDHSHCEPKAKQSRGEVMPNVNSPGLKSLNTKMRLLRDKAARNDSRGGHAHRDDGAFVIASEVQKPLSCRSGPVELDYVWLELTKSCNLTCAHCYAGAGNNIPHPLASRERESISLKQWKNIIAECSRLGAREIQFTGGEPTLYPGLMVLIEHARSCRYTDIEVFTNATRLEDSLLRQWSNLGVRTALSFYSSDAHTHDKITGSKGSFSQTVQGIRDIIHHNISVRVAIVLMRDNMSHLADTVAFLKGLGLKDGEIEWDYVRPTGRGVAGAINVGKDEKMEVAPFKPSSLTEEGQGACNKVFAMGTCWKGKIAISCEGDVSPCIFARKMSAGKYPEVSLEEIIRGQALQRLWQITMDEVETCRDCELRYGCFDCRALAQTITGDLFSKNPRCRYNPYTGLMERNGGLKMEERPKKRKDIVNGDVGDEVVLYDSKNDNVHHLNLLASVIWDLCDGNRTVKDIAGEIVDVLKADPVQVELDVTKMIEEFQGKGLLEEASKQTQ